jgi:hypothetical protein
MRLPDPRMAIFGLAISAIVAQQPVGVMTTPSERPSVRLTAFVRDPKISASGDLSQWSDHRLSIGFSPYQPDNKGALPLGVETIVYAGWGHDGLYVAIEAIDPDPSRIVSGKRKRDSIPDREEDFVSLIVDPTGRGQYGYEFRVTPSGVQQDARIIETSSPDPTFDLLWESKAARTDRGYVIKMRIPYDSLGAVRDGWRLRVLRNWPRERYYTMTWPIQNEQPYSFLTNAGTVTGCAVTQDKGMLMAIVSATGEKTYASSGSEKISDTNVGLDVRWRSMGGTRADLTIKPDFSTVESDINPLAVNTRFKTSLPEKRPFFLEGMDTLLDANLVQQVNTRSILRPQIGMKTSSIQGDLSWGVLAVSDKGGGDAMATDGALTEGFQTRDMAGAIAYGYKPTESLEGRTSMTVTNRAVVDAPNREDWRSSTYGIHTVCQYAGAWTAYGDAVASDYRLPFKNGVPTTATRGSAYGYGVNYDGEHVNASFVDTRISPDARMDLGFISLAGLKAKSSSISYRIRSNGSFWTQLQAGVAALDMTEWGGSPFSKYNNASISASFKHRIDLSFTYGLPSQEWYLGTPYDVPSSTTTLTIGSIPGQKLSFLYTSGKSIDYYQAITANYTQMMMRFSGRFGPVSYDIRPLAIRLADPVTGIETLDAKRIYTKVEWALPLDDWFFRTEYQNVKTDRLLDLTDSTSMSKKSSVAMGYLLRWQPNPFAGVFIGYNQQRGKLDFYRERQYDELLQKGLFVKVSYSKQF